MKEEKGTKLSSYKLPVTKQESTREGFEGVGKKQWMKLDDLKAAQAPNTTKTTDKAKSLSHGKQHGFEVKLDKNTCLG